MHETVADKVAEAARDLITQNWGLIETSFDSAKFTINLAVTIRPESGGFGLQTSLSFAKKFKDEREDFVDNPNQIGMEFDKDE